MEPTGVNKILVEKYGYEWVNGKAWAPGTAPEPEVSTIDVTRGPLPDWITPPPADAFVTQALETLTNPVTGEKFTVPTGGYTVNVSAPTPIENTSPAPSLPVATPESEPPEPLSLEEKIEQLQASLSELQKKYEEALQKLEQANATIAELKGQQSETPVGNQSSSDLAPEPEATPSPEPIPSTPQAPAVEVPEPASTPSDPEPTGVNKILVEKYGYEWVNGKAWKPGTAPEVEIILKDGVNINPAPKIVFFEDFNDVNLEGVLAKNPSHGSLTSNEPYAITREPTEWNTSQTSVRGKNGDLEYFWNDPFNEGNGEYLVIETGKKVEGTDGFIYQVKFDLGFHPVQMINDNLDDELTFTARLKFGDTIASEKTISHLDTTYFGTSSVLLSASSKADYLGDDISIEFTASSNRGFLANSPINNIEIDNVYLSHMHQKYVSEPGFEASGPLDDSIPLQEVTVTFADSSSWIAVKDGGLHRYFANDNLVSRTQFTETNINSEILEAGFSNEQTIWIAQDNAVRKVIKYRSPLHNEDNSRIAREDLGIVSPYGAGDWAEETLIVYPDGIVSRTIQIWSNAVQNSYAGFHAWNENYYENPGSTVFEVHERTITSLNKDLEVMDVFGTEPVILIDSEKNIFQPDWKGSPKLYKFENPVAELIDLDYTDQTLFAILPAGNTVANKYQETSYENTDHYYTNFHDGSLGYKSDNFAVPLSQLENLDFFEKSETSATQTYLQGLANEGDALDKVMTLQKSWQNPAEVEAENALKYISYSQTERAYLFELLDQNSEALSIDFQASRSSPVDGLVIKIKDWEVGTIPKLSSTQIDVEMAKFGIENESDLLVWLPVETVEEFKINIEIM